MKLSKAANGLFNFWSKQGATYRRMKADENKRKTSYRLGVQSILATLACTAFVLLFIWFAQMLYLNIATTFETPEYSFPVLSIIGLCVCCVTAFFLFVKGVLYGLIAWIYQLRLNRTFCGWLALVVWLACAIGIVVFVFVIT